MNALLADIQAAAARGPVLMDQVGDNLATIQSAGSGIVQNVEVLSAILDEARASIESFHVILENLERGSQDIPQVTATARDGIREIRQGVENIDRVVQSLQRNVIIRSNLPDEPTSMNMDAGLRPE
jgi:methyl-accepting chemotaxis protein